MLEKIKAFLKRYRTLVIIVGVILIIFILILFTLFSREKTDDPQDLEIDRIGYEEENGQRMYYDNYQINMPGYLVEEVNQYSDSYNVFNVKDISHLEWVESFVSATKGSTLEYMEKAHPAIPGHSFHTVDQTIHYWQDNNNTITYDNATDLLFFEFDMGVSIQGIQMNPQSEESVKSALEAISSRFFSDTFEYSINDISRTGNYYRVDYSRVLEELPINGNLWDTYLLFSPDGRLKEGMFLLAEFERSTEISVPTGDEVKENINQLENYKSVSFRLLGVDEYERFGEYGYHPTGEEIGLINLEMVDLEYRYYSKFDEVVKPVFFFEGEGYVEIEGENIDAYFYVETN